VFLSDSAYVDIISARDELRMPLAGNVVTDQVTAQTHLVPVDPSIQTQRRSSIDAIYTLAGDCRRVAIPTCGARDLDGLTGRDFDPWSGGLRIAADRGIALWADDTALRRHARGAGLLAFSTLALLDAYARIGLVSSEQREGAVRKLILGYVGDFQPDELRLRALASIGANGLGAVASAMAKPAFWSSTTIASSVYIGLCGDLNAASPDAIPGLLQASALGIIRTGLPSPQADDLCSRIAAAAINVVGPLGNVPQLLLALRSALNESNPPTQDILPLAVRHLLRAFEAVTVLGGPSDPSLAANNVQALFARCSADDQSTVRRTILSAP
jgi:hypothetical protein